MEDNTTAFCPRCGGAIPVPVVIKSIVREGSGYMTVDFNAVHVAHQCVEPK